MWQKVAALSIQGQESSEEKQQVLAKNHCKNLESWVSNILSLKKRYWRICPCNWKARKWKEPEENNKTVSLQNHANHWPAYKDHEKTNPKWYCTLSIQEIFKEKNIKQSSIIYSNCKPFIKMI